MKTKKLNALDNCVSGRFTGRTLVLLLLLFAGSHSHSLCFAILVQFSYFFIRIFLWHQKKKDCRKCQQTISVRLVLCVLCWLRCIAISQSQYVNCLINVSEKKRTKKTRSSCHCDRRKTQQCERDPRKMKMNENVLTHRYVIVGSIIFSLLKAIGSRCQFHSTAPHIYK